MSSLERLARAPGLTPIAVCETLAEFARQIPRDQVIVEIGVYKGRTSCYLAHGARYGGGAHVFGIDPWDLPGRKLSKTERRLAYGDTRTYREAQRTVRVQGMGRYVTLIRGFSTDVAASWSDDRKIGLLYVDGNHFYEHVRGDVLAWRPYLAENAVIVFDDYMKTVNPDVSRAVQDLVDEGVLQPVEILHDQIAVTRLGDAPAVTVHDHAPEPEPELEPEPEQTESTDDETLLGVAGPDDDRGEVDLRTDTEREADEQAAASRLTREPEPQPVTSDDQGGDETPESESATNDATSEPEPPQEEFHDVPPEPVEIDFDGMNVKTLKVYGDHIGADLTGKHKREDVLIALETRREELPVAERDRLDREWTERGDA